MAELDYEVSVEGVEQAIVSLDTLANRIEVFGDTFRMLHLASLLGRDQSFWGWYLFSLGKRAGDG